MQNRELIKNHLAIVHRLAAEDGDPLLLYLIDMALLQNSAASASESIDVPVPMTPKSTLEAFVSS